MAGRGRPPFPGHGNKTQKKICQLSWIGRKVLEERQPPKSDSSLQPSESDSFLNMVGQEQGGTAPSSTELGCLTCHESKGSVHIALEFLNALIEYRSEYLIYPFESQVATEDFIKNWITVPKRTFENLIDEFQRTYLDEIPDSAIDLLGPVEQKVCELAKKIWVTDGMRIAEEDNIRVRFLERLTNDVNDQITFLKKIIEHLPKTPTARLPMDDLPPIDNLIKNWLKVEVPRSELEKMILTLRRKYSRTESKGEKITVLKEEYQKAIQLAEMIWGPVCSTQNHNDEDRMENLTDG